MLVNVTPAAIDQIEKICLDNPSKMVRFSVESGGCNGFSKTFNLDDVIREDDLIIECFSGKLLIDSISLEFLKNGTIDYKTALVGSFFDVTIPTSVSSCGCGTSFAI